MPRKDGDPAPYYEAHVFCCTNERPAGHKRGSCAAKGAVQLRNYFKARAKEAGLESVRINSAGCLDRCEEGPCVVIYPEGIWYGIHSTEDVDAIITTHLIEGGRVKRLMIDPPAGGSKD